MSPVTAKIIHLNLVNIVDELGTVKAEIANLKAREEFLKKALEDSGETAIDGTLFRATVATSQRTNIDWKTIAEKLEPSRQLITAHTSVGYTTAVRVTARKTS